LKTILTFIFLFNIIKTFGQNTIGLPNLHNYNKFDYNGGLQNWDIKQDKNGIIYFANNEGLLSFDGVYWKIFPLPNKTIVRSIAISNDNKIYVGGQDELGYFEADDKGVLQFHSLIPLIPANNRTFGDVWDIVIFDKEIYCRTSIKIFKIKNNNTITYNASSEWLYLGICNNTLYAQDKESGLALMDNNDWKPLFNQNNLPKNDPITSILQNKNGYKIITTLKNGLYSLMQNTIIPITNPTNSIFKNERIYNATLINSENIALATTNNGVYIIDFEGNIIQSFSKTEGLQNKNVLSIFADKQKNLWLGLDNGIDFINYNSAIKQINPFLQDGSGYTAIINHNNLYIGTSNGLCFTTLQNEKDISFSKSNFTNVNNTKGQVWTLAEVNDQLILGHHEGAFIIKNNSAIPISNNLGYWNFSPITNTFPATTMITGSYKGISFFDYKNNTFIQSNVIDSFEESSRFVTMDNNGNIWVSHPYHGVYKISKNSNNKYKTTIYSASNGLPSTLNNHIFKIKNEVVVATIKGIYSYNLDKNAFEPSIFYRNIFGEISIRYIKEDDNGNIWFINEKRIGVADVHNKNKTLTFFPELTNKLLSGFEFIYPYNENNILVGGANGMYHINYEKYKTNATELPIFIRNVEIFNIKDSVIFGGNYVDSANTSNKLTAINNKWKLIRFEFASPFFGFDNNVEYSYRLKGFDKEWSEWTKRTEKDYTNLPAGKYVFEVKAKNNLGKESSIAAYTFKILPPWYTSTIAIIGYFLLFGLSIFSIITWQKKKFKTQQQKYEEEQKKLLYILELERNKKESEIVAIQNEKLEADINYQNTELAASAMHLVKKGELLTKIKTELTQVAKSIESNEAKSEIKKLTKALQADDNMDQEWDHFAKHFDKVHSDFLIQLKAKHPTITPNELKLSAYLRMNLSTKEIAQLMNISIRGVEISRYRLRKKLGIITEISLFDYLIAI
jgi:ligand-binding sensor domain-containing protein/DNA-binding CsgD family transcriptional regulator